MIRDLRITGCLQLSKLDIPALHLLRNKSLTASTSSSISLSEALELYLRLKEVKIFHKGAERNIKFVVDVLGDRPNRRREQCWCGARLW